MISIRSGVLVAVNRPPGCGNISAIWLSGLAGSGFGLLGLTEATSNAAVGDTAVGGAAEACADAVVARSRMARAKPHVERIIVISTFFTVVSSASGAFLTDHGACAEQAHV